MSADLKIPQPVLPDQEQPGEQQVKQQDMCWCCSQSHQLWVQYEQEGWVRPVAEVGWCQHCHAKPANLAVVVSWCGHEEQCLQQR